MLKTLFTGHTLNVANIVAVGPLMTSLKTLNQPFVRRTLYLEIFLKDNVILRHEAYNQTYLDGTLDQKQQDNWKAKVDELETQRAAFINEWAQSDFISKTDTIPT